MSFHLSGTNAITPNIPAAGVAGGSHAAFLPIALGPVDPNFLAMFASLRNVPVLATAGLEDPLVPVSNTTTEALKLDQLGYRHDSWWFTGNHQEYRYWVYDEYSQLSNSTGPNDRDPSHITYTAGTIQIAGDHSIGTDATIAGFYGNSPTIPTGKQLTVEGIATIAASTQLTLTGGTLAADTVLMSPGMRA